jgi:hypothetical protein
LVLHRLNGMPLRVARQLDVRRELHIALK